MFCVECGREGNIFEALCAPCFFEHKKLIELPDVIDLDSCIACNSMFIEKKWQKKELEAVIDDIIASALWHNPIIKILNQRKEIRFEDQRNISVEVTTKVGLDGFEKELHNKVRIRLKSGTCPTCSMRHGSYYEAIIQVRPGEQPISDDVLSEIRDYVHTRVSASSDPEGKDFISKEEVMHNGVDFYLGNNRIAKSISKDLAKKYSGTVNASPKLHGRVKGKEVYRVTYIVRLP